MSEQTSWGIDQGRLIDHVLVSRSDYLSEEPWTVIDSLSQFAALAHRDGGLTDRELPPEVLWNSQVTAFCLQVDRNGVAGYINNVIVAGQDDPERLARNREAAERGLAAVGAARELAVLRHAYALHDQFAAEFLEANRNRRLLKNEAIDALFQVWIGLDPEALLAARVTWIRGLAMVRAVEDERLPAELDRLWSLNPLREQRRRELERAERAEIEAIRIEQRRQAEAWQDIQAAADREQRRKAGLLGAVRSFLKR